MRRIVQSILFSFVAVSANAQVPTPSEHLGRPLGADFTLADWSEVTSYYGKLASTTNRVKLEVVGKTTEGRDFPLALISSESNLANLDALRAANAKIADPRGLTPEAREAVLASAKPFVMISPAMHSTETAAPQFAMRLAHELATSDQAPWPSIRDNVVVLLMPCTNPDGLERVVQWYRKTVGTEFEATGLTDLYQHYAGHDNNRDWFMLSLAETRIVTELLYSKWRPQVYWDVHQQGSRAERMFIPPFRDPLDPNLDPGIITGIDALCSRALADMTRGGFTGVASGITYDMWWNGGNRNVPVRHNIIGILTEAASVDLATPLFLKPGDLRAPGDLKTYSPSNRFPAPWPGGWWRLAHIIDYEMSFGQSLLASVAREPRHWLENAIEAAERAIEKGKSQAPRAYVISAENRDRAATWRLVDVLQRTGVELSAATAQFTADGRTWPEGSLVIRLDQPYGQYVKDLFEVQRYPTAGDPPYDVAGWSLPTLLGVRASAIEFGLPNTLATKAVASPDEALVGFPSRVGAEHDGADGMTWRAIFARLAKGGVVLVDDHGESVPDYAVSFPEALAKSANAAIQMARNRMPRVGVYDTWSGSMDEGWLRFVLDSFSVPYITVTNEMLRAGHLSDFLDILVLPSISAREIEDGRTPGSVAPEYSGGLDPSGNVAIDEFVRTGGKLIAADSSARYAIDLFKLPIGDAARGEKAKDFSCPGSVLRLIPESNADWRYVGGLEPSLACFFDSSTAFEVEKGAENIAVLARYAPSTLLLSGWIKQPEAIEGKAAWVKAKVGDGNVVLFGFRPHYRSWSQQTFYLLFRSILAEDRRAKN